VLVSLAGERSPDSGRYDVRVSVRPSSPKASRVRLKPADSFDLIRLLARSQSDARKAVAELVQNSLDAGAHRIQVTWLNDHGARLLRLWDDGQGIFPELSREDALRRIAQTIGHSHKRSLTLEQRRELMALGKYGIGLLGFWCVGRHMDIKSRVGGGETWVLRLEEDRPDARIERARSRRVDDLATFTEVEIRAVHEGVQRQIRPGRLQAYLAGELRGQLLGRDVLIEIFDRVARGTAHKHFVVKPQRFLGRPLPEFTTLAVPGHDEARVELYLVPADEERRGGVQLACGGTTVLDDLALLDDDEGPRAPWDSGRLEGVIDFPELEVAPGSRRGFQRNDAAVAFLTALHSLEMQLMAVIAEDERTRDLQKHKNLAREIRRAFRKVVVALPQYDLFDVRAGAGTESAVPEGAELVQELAAQEREEISATEETSSPDSEASLFPPGPLERIRVQPGRLRLAPGALRTLRAKPLDGDGRTAEGAFEWSWSLEGGGTLSADGAEARYGAPEEPGEARIVVSASQRALRAEAAVEVTIQA